MAGPAAPAPRTARSQPSAPSKQRARKSPARARGAEPARAPSAPKARRTSPARGQAGAATPERAPSAPRKRTRASPASKRPPSAAAPAAAAPAAKQPAAKRRQAAKPDPTQACRWPVMLCGLVTLCVCALLSPLALVVLQRTPAFAFMARAPAPLSPRPPLQPPSPNRLSPRPPPPEDDDEILCDCGWTNYAGQSCPESRGKEGFPCWSECCSS